MASISDFISETLGKSLDLDGRFGAQSPDFGVAYLRHMTGDDTLTVAGNAIDWANPGHPDLAPHGTWHPAGSGPRKPGDICVFSNQIGYGTIGISRGQEYLEDEHLVWSQNPGPVRKMALRENSNHLVGWWRLPDAG